MYMGGLFLGLKVFFGYIGGYVDSNFCMGRKDIRVGLNCGLLSNCCDMD